MKRLLWSGATAVAALSLVLAAHSAPTKVGSKAPNFSSKSTAWPKAKAGKTTSLAQYKGKVVLVNFFDYN